MPSLPRSVTALPALLLALLCAATLVLAGAPSARAAGEDGQGAITADEPVRLVIATAGLDWRDVTPEVTPHLQCLADRSGLGAMNTTSVSVVSTMRQGMETIRSGYRGLAADAPRTAGIPDPAVDQWEQLGVPVTEVDGGGGPDDAGSDDAAGSDEPADPAVSTASTLPDGAADEISEALGAEDGIVLVDLGGLPDRADPERADALTALDARAGEVIDAAGGCDADSLPRTLTLSVAAIDPADPDASERTGAMASRSAGLQVAMDSALPGRALTSGATKQPGVVMLTDVAPTILASYGASSEGLLNGQPVRGTESADPQQLVKDRSLAALEVDDATIPALGSWLALGVMGLVLLLVPALARRPRLQALGRALTTIAPLALPVGLMASLVPWWRAEHPALALTGVVWAGSALLALVVLAGPWRRVPRGSVAVSAALVGGIVLLESATGSRLQLGSPLGAQPISGGRFYGLSNHLFGIVLAASLIALLCLFTLLRTTRARVLWTLGVGVAVAVVCVTPSMGADFGSMLATVPTFGLLALLVSGIRLCPWHVISLLAGGAVLVLGVSFLDWLRPPEDRTHLGRFIDELLSGELVAVVVRKLAQNVGMTLGYPALTVLLVLALACSVAALMPRRARLTRLAALYEEHPSALHTMIAVVAGGWLGYAVNDTGPVLGAAMFGIVLVLLPPALPSPGDEPTAHATGTRTDDSTSARLSTEGR